jgi:hypothetical protein
VVCPSFLIERAGHTAVVRAPSRSAARPGLAHVLIAACAQRKHSCRRVARCATVGTTQNRGGAAPDAIRVFAGCGRASDSTAELIGGFR